MHIIEVHEQHIKKTQFNRKECAVALACIEAGLKDVGVSFPAIRIGNESFWTSVDVANWILLHDFYLEYQKTITPPPPITIQLKNGQAELFS